MKPVRHETHANTIALANLVALMLRGELDCEELARETGLHITTVYRYTAALYRAGAAHIAKFKPDNRGALTIRVFKVGEGVDAVPPVYTRTERARAQRLRDKIVESYLAPRAPIRSRPGRAERKPKSLTN